MLRVMHQLAPVLDLIQLDCRIAIPGCQERLPKLANGDYTPNGGAARWQDDRVWRIRPEDCFYVSRT
jgi:hypothetical protein